MLRSELATQTKRSSEARKEIEGDDIHDVQSLRLYESNASSWIDWEHSRGVDKIVHDSNDVSPSDSCPSRSKTCMADYLEGPSGSTPACSFLFFCNNCF